MIMEERQDHVWNQCLKLDPVFLDERSPEGRVRDAAEV